MTAMRLIHCILWLEKEKSVTKSEKKKKKMDEISKAIIKLFRRNIAKNSRKIMEIPAASHHHELCSIFKSSLLNISHKTTSSTNLVFSTLRTFTW